MNQGRTLRIKDVGAYLGVSHQRADQVFHAPRAGSDGRYRPDLEGDDDRAVGRTGVVGHAAVAETVTLVALRDQWK